MADAATTGRTQRQQTATAVARTPNLEKFYSRSLPPIHPGDFEFHLDVLRPRQRPFPLESMVDSLTWTDQTSPLNGTLTAYRPDPEDPATLPVSRGDLIRCRLTWADHMYKLWTMRVQPVQTELDTANASVSLTDDLALLDSTKLDWFFRKTKARPHGYTADEITIKVAQRMGVGVGKLAKGSNRMALVRRGASALDVLKAAWANEKAKTGTGFVIRLRDGKIEVVPIRRNPLLYVIKQQIQTALITQKGGDKVPVTVLEGRGHIGQGKHAQKVSYTEYDRQTVQTLGYVHQQKNYGRVRSHAELRALVKQDYAAGLRMNDNIVITHQGIPFIERGDGVEVDLPREGYGGKNAFVYCTQAIHTVQAATYTTQWTFDSTDPYLAEFEAEQKAAKQRADKRQQRATRGSG